MRSLFSKVPGAQNALATPGDKWGRVRSQGPREGVVQAAEEHPRPGQHEVADAAAADSAVPPTSQPFPRGSPFFAHIMPSPTVGKEAGDEGIIILFLARFFFLVLR